MNTVHPHPCSRIAFSLFTALLLAAVSRVDAADTDGSVDLTDGSSGSVHPNIVLLMCDDLGYGDLKPFWADSLINTPHLDQMTESGLKFNRFYAAAPVCSPTRGSCLTGRHPSRYGIPYANVGHLPEDEVTIPELLKPLGYRSGHFGKWHLGTLTKTIKDANRGGPNHVQDFSPPRFHGYDVSFVTESKVPTYDPMVRPAKNNKIGWDYLRDDQKKVDYGTAYWDHDGNVDGENLAGDDSRVIMDRAVAFIEESVAKKKPFFTAIWFHSPHLPVVAGPEHVEPYRDFSMHQRNYYGCVSAMDEQVGRLRGMLRSLGVHQNTMVWFCSDNGPEGKSNSPGLAGSFSGRKRSLKEGGVRVPGILEWPGTISPGEETNAAAVTSDYLPTIADLLNIDLTNASVAAGWVIDGESLVPIIKKKSPQRTKPIGFLSRKQIAWHDGSMKLYSDDAGSTWVLYDLGNDPSEKSDLSAAKADLLQTMKKDVQAWLDSVNSDQG